MEFTRNSPVAADCRLKGPVLLAFWFWAAFVLGYYFWSIGPALDLIPAAFNFGAFDSSDGSKMFLVFRESFLILLAMVLVKLNNKTL